jgi:hypothetical protein
MLGNHLGQPVVLAARLTSGDRGDQRGLDGKEAPSSVRGAA